MVPAVHAGQPEVRGGGAERQRLHRRLGRASRRRQRQGKQEREAKGARHGDTSGKALG
jgi:hypothetical protein